MDIDEILAKINDHIPTAREILATNDPDTPLGRPHRDILRATYDTLAQLNRDQKLDVTLAKGMSSQAMQRIESATRRAEDNERYR